MTAMANAPTRSQSLRYRKLRLACLGLTAALFFGHYLLPAKYMPLSISRQISELYGYADSNRGISAQWMNDRENGWICDYKPADAYGCGWSVRLDRVLGKGKDLRGFDALVVHLNYDGPAKRLRASIRNHNPAYSDLRDSSSSKPMEASFSAAETGGPVLIPLNELKVADWWLAERKFRRRWPSVELDNILAVGIDFTEPGYHRVSVEHVALVGRWIKTEALLIGILSFWMAVFLGEGAMRFYRLYRAAQLDRQVIRALEEKRRSLAEENQHLENLANTDPLTGIYNRAGLNHRLETLARRDKGLTGVGVLALDLDHFKALNDHYGHDMGDKVLKTFAALLAMNLRSEDVFARTGGEEFVVVCRRQPVDGVHAVAEKLRRLAGQCTFNGEDSLAITVSIGVAIMAEDESIDAVLMRADAALYRAKQNGRNRVEFDSAL
jgi:diguanylate cyclase (GGDEF)-like protein